MTTELTLRNIGNSRGVILTTDVLSALGINSASCRLLLSINKKKRTGTISVTDSPAPAGNDPFACLSKYADLWNADPRSDIDIAEELKSGRNDIDR